MTMSEVNSDGTKNRTKHKQSDVMCWNCFKSEGSDDEPTDIEPVPLSKVREEHRKKLKVYSFLASELSKPKAVSFKQKISEPYKIGKEIDTEISKHQSNLEDFEKEVFPDNIRNGTLSPQEQNISHNKSITPELQIITSKSNKSLLSNKEKEITESIIETTKRKILVQDSSSLISQKNILHHHDPTNEQSNRVDRKLKTEQLKCFESPSGLSVTKNDFKEYISPVKKEKAFESHTSEQLKSIIEIPSPEVNKELSGRNNFDEINKKTDLPKLTPSQFTNINTFSKIPVLKHSPVMCQKTKVKDNLNVTSGDLNEVKAKSVLKGINEVDRPSEIILEHKNENFIDGDKIIHKVEIVTSTPKKKYVANNINDGKADLKFYETKEEPNSDKIDNASSNGSESGYTGSLATVQEFVIDEAHEERKEIEEVKNKDDDIEKLTSSLSSLNIVAKKPIMHSSSLSSDIHKLGRKLPTKTTKWSTLSMVPRSVSFEDEVYISEAVSPGHATLPRRSNSPLPHERDMDRDRFPINRSGLQARSESMASVYSGAGEGLRGSVTVKGEVQFSLLYNYRLGALEVGVKRCRDLAPIDVKRNRSDPYVKVYLLPDKSKAGKRKTKVKKNTLNPVFEETLSFVQPLASLSARTLWLSAWHADMFGRNDFLGEVTLSLADVVFDDPAPMWYKLHERTEQFDEQHGSRGDLIVGLKFELKDAARGSGTLHVLVKEAKNLVANKPNGLCDVFCKSYLLPERGRLAKQKTVVVRRSLNPRWEHTFVYRGLTMQELATRALELSLWDRDRLASNDFMGAVRLSLATGTYMGAPVNWMDSVGKEITLWQNMMQQPNLWVEGSLPLRPQLIN